MKRFNMTLPRSINRPVITKTRDPNTGRYECKIDYPINLVTEHYIVVT